jgi:hypothetical protein
MGGPGNISHNISPARREEKTKRNNWEGQKTKDKGPERAAVGFFDRARFFRKH